MKHSGRKFLNLVSTATRIRVGEAYRAGRGGSYLARIVNEGPAARSVLGKASHFTSIRSLVNSNTIRPGSRMASSSRAVISNLSTGLRFATRRAKIHNSLRAAKIASGVPNKSQWSIQNNKLVRGASRGHEFYGNQYVKISRPSRYSLKRFARLSRAWKKGR